MIDFRTRRKTISKKKVIIILALLSVFMLAGCSGQAWDTMKDEGKKTFGTRAGVKPAVGIRSKRCKFIMDE